MAEEFRFELTAEEKSFLKDLVRRSILSRLEPGSVDLPAAPPTPRLEEPLGAFVTLKVRGRLRGCIGFIHGGKPVWRTIQDMARAAAFEDPRFPPLSRAEFDQADVEISILSPVTPCPDPEKIVIGRHGLIMRRGGRQGLLLPQVPVEWKWDRLAFLEHTCGKAGLEPGCWKEKGTEIYWFEAEVF